MPPVLHNMGRYISNLVSRPYPINGLVERNIRRLIWPVICTVAARKTFRTRLTNGRPFLIRANDQISKMIFEFGCYEPELLSVLLPLVQPGMTVLDIGANIGYYSVILSQLVGPGGRVHAFEINESVIELLEQNIQLAGTANICLVRKAVSVVSGNADFYAPSPGSEMEGGLRESRRYHAQKVIRVETVSIDDYMREQALSKVDIIKIDIEGGELDAFHGATRLLTSANRPIILFESLDSACGNFGVTWLEVVEKVQAFGYRIHQASAGNFIAVPA